MKTASIDLLTKLVSIPSPSEHETKAATYLTGWMNAHGLTAYVDEVGNAVGVKGDGPREILLLGHIDTFPGEVPVRREGDLLYGRGSVDAKGPLCAFAAATAQVEVPDDWRVTVIGAVEEENATSRGARYILKQRRREAKEQGSKDTEETTTKQSGNESTQSPNPSTSPRLEAGTERLRTSLPILRLRSGQVSQSPPPAYCIIGEPSHWDRVTLGYKGRLLMDVTIHAPFSHSAGAERLPAEQAVDFWRQIEQFCADANEERLAATSFNQLDPSLRHIANHDEGAFGVVEMSLGFRLPVGISPPDLEQKLRRLVQKLPNGTTAELQFSGEELAYKGSKSNPLVRAFLQAIRAAGGQPRFVVKTGTADMNVVAPHWPNTPIVAYGPGDSHLDHTPNEHIDLNEYLRATEVLKAVLAGLVYLPHSPLAKRKSSG